MDLKTSEIHRHWVEQPVPPADYSKIDPATLKRFTGTHPEVVQDWLPEAEGVFRTDPNHQLTSRERKHRRLLWLEKTFGLRFDKKHYRLVR